MSTIEFKRIRFDGPAIVVAFDICSSTNVIEELTTNTDVARYTDFVGELKRYLMRAQPAIPFDPYKFTGDGWILLFPPTTSGVQLKTFLEGLCAYFATTFENQVVRFLSRRPSQIGLTFGIDKGVVIPLTMFQQPEYVGRAINVACRLQGAVKDKGRPPAYDALVTNLVFNEYFSELSFIRVDRVKRVLRNVNNDEPFGCRRISLRRPNNAVKRTQARARRLTPSRLRRSP